MEIFFSIRAQLKPQKDKSNWWFKGHYPGLFLNYGNDKPGILLFYFNVKERRCDKFHPIIPLPVFYFKKQVERWGNQIFPDRYKKFSGNFHSSTTRRWSAFKQKIDKINCVRNCYLTIAVCIACWEWLGVRTSFEQIVYQVNYIRNR